MSEQIKREFVLNYSIEKVKKAIEDACSTSTGSYQIKARNDAFGTYSIALVKMLSVLPVTLEIKRLGDNETEVNLSAVAGPHLSRTPTFLSEMIEGFLTKVGDFLSGRLVVRAPVQRQPPSRKRILLGYFILIGVISGIIAVIYFLSKY